MQDPQNDIRNRRTRKYSTWKMTDQNLSQTWRVIIISSDIKNLLNDVLNKKGKKLFFEENITTTAKMLTQSKPIVIYSSLHMS